MKKRLFMGLLCLYFIVPWLYIHPKRSFAQVVSSAECVMELEQRRILYESHGDARLPMASTTISNKTDACINAPIPKKQARPNVISKKITITIKIRKSTL